MKRTLAALALATLGLLGLAWLLDAAVSELADIDATSCPPLHDPTRKDPS